jgi:hypothetical protein
MAESISQPLVLAVKNWREFQHYAKRRPPWIKLQHRLLDDRVFLTLPVASKALAPLLWLLASESIDGKNNDAMAEITYRLRMSEHDVIEALSPLIAAGFFIVEQGAIPTLAERKPLSAAQTESEQRRGEAPTGLPPEEHKPSLVAARASEPRGLATPHKGEMPPMPNFLKRIPS